MPTAYDDGGFSDGTMNRPGLKQLMADVAAGKVDVLVVYKVDRLTRTLSHFARIVDILDAAGASFVSVTQSFNTTTSMGRLTLNVLLSFAQFEREVTGERIRDKVAASKAKGIWMGGNVPLGYDVRDRALVVNPAEAETVRTIFERYLALGSIRELAVSLDRSGIRSKARIDADSTDRGSRIMTPGALAHILRNRICLGLIVHKGEAYPGAHAAIVDQPVWDAVQALIADNRTNDHASRAEHPSLLIGMIEDAEGRPMTPCHANKQGRRYRYYVTRPDTCGRRAETGWRLPAGEIETLVTARIAAWLRDAAAIAGIGTALPAASLPALLTQCERLATTIEDDRKAAARALLVDLQARVRVADTGVTISLSPAHLIAMATATPAPAEAVDRITIETAVTLVRRGHELRLVHRPQDQTQPATPDVKLIGLIAKAEAAHRELTTNETIAKNRKPHLLRLARLRYLAPDITAAILEGRQPVQLSARRLLRADTIPLCWKEQRASLGFG